MTAPPATGTAPSAAAADLPRTDLAQHAVAAVRAIWDERRPGLVERWYAPTAVIRTADGAVLDRDALVAGIVRRSAAFPDLCTYIADTVCAGDDREGRVSLRWTWVARHTGSGDYGAPTGRAVAVSGVTVWTLAGGRVTAEWSVHDEVSLLRQLGVGIGSHLRRLEARGGAGSTTAHAPPLPPRTDSDSDSDSDSDHDQGPGQDHDPGQGPHPGPDHDAVTAAVHRCADQVWNRRLVGEVDRAYAPRCVVHLGSDRVLYGAEEVKQEVMAWLCLLPDARLRVEDVLWQEASSGRRRRVVTRWTLVGTHTGPGRLGAPTGRAVRVHGITHSWLAGGRVVEEWIEHSELDLLRQLLRAQGPPPQPTKELS